MPRHSDSRLQLVRSSRRWLAEHPNAPLVDRVAHATVLCAGGEVGRRRFTFGDVGRMIGVPASEVLQAMLALRDRREAK